MKKWDPLWDIKAHFAKKAKFIGGLLFGKHKHKHRGRGRRPARRPRPPRRPRPSKPSVKYHYLSYRCKVRLCKRYRVRYRIGSIWRHRYNTRCRFV